MLKNISFRIHPLSFFDTTVSSVFHLVILNYIKSKKHSSKPIMNDDQGHEENDAQLPALEQPAEKKPSILKAKAEQLATLPAKKNVAAGTKKAEENKKPKKTETKAAATTTKPVANKTAATTKTTTTTTKTTTKTGPQPKKLRAAHPAKGDTPHVQPPKKKAKTIADEPEDEDEDEAALKKADAECEVEKERLAKMLKEDKKKDKKNKKEKNKKDEKEKNKKDEKEKNKNKEEKEKQKKRKRTEDEKEEAEEKKEEVEEEKDEEDESSSSSSSSAPPKRAEKSKKQTMLDIPGMATIPTTKTQFPPEGLDGNSVTRGDMIMKAIEPEVRSGNFSILFKSADQTYMDWVRAQDNFNQEVTNVWRRSPQVTEKQNARLYDQLFNMIDQFGLKSAKDYMRANVVATYGKPEKWSPEKRPAAAKTLVQLLDVLDKFFATEPNKQKMDLSYRSNMLCEEKTPTKPADTDLFGPRLGFQYVAESQERHDEAGFGDQFDVQGAFPKPPMAQQEQKQPSIVVPPAGVPSPKKDPLVMPPVLDEDIVMSDSVQLPQQQQQQQSQQSLFTMVNPSIDVPVADNNKIPTPTPSMAVVAGDFLRFSAALPPSNNHLQDDDDEEESFQPDPTDPHNPLNRQPESSEYEGY